MNQQVLHLFTECILGIAQLAVGVGIGVWFLQRRGVRPEADLRRARDLAMQLHELTTFVTSSVDQHHEQVATIDAQLRIDNNNGGEGDRPVTDLVVGVVGEMIRANRELSGKLFQAQHQLEQKTAEIEAHITEAMTDPLTELPNRRALDEQLASRMDGWRKHNLPFSLLLIDVDHFKRFNDTHGHQVGDAVLKLVGESLRTALRRHDFVARFGGEEFAVLLPYTTLDDAMIAVRKALGAISEATLMHQGELLRITASGGLANVQPYEEGESLVRRADEALYAAKAGGRDRGYAHFGKSCAAIPAEACGSLPAAPPIDIASDANLEPLSEQLLAACVELREHVERLSAANRESNAAKPVTSGS
ncbi:MAG: GGDEF domain-containing protein [Pirellulales bacterium]